MSNLQRDLARLRTRKRPPETNDELPATSPTSQRADGVNLQRFVGNRGMQSMIAQRMLLDAQIPGGNRFRSIAIQRSRNPLDTGKDEDQAQLRQGSPTLTNDSFVQRAPGGFDEEPPNVEKLSEEVNENVIKQVELGRERTQDPYDEPNSSGATVSDDGSFIEFPPQHVDTGGNSSGATVSDDGSFIEFPPQDVDTGGNSSGATVSDDGSFIEFPPQDVDTGGGASSTPETSDDGGFIEFPPQVIDEW